MTHPSLLWERPARVREELAGCTAAIEDATGEAVKWFRPPFGARRPMCCAPRRTRPVMWNITAHDWDATDLRPWRRGYNVAFTATSAGIGAATSCARRRPHGWEPTALSRSRRLGSCSKMGGSGLRYGHRGRLIGAEYRARANVRTKRTGHSPGATSARAFKESRSNNPACTTAGTGNRPLITLSRGRLTGLLRKHGPERLRGFHQG
jgi:hypothetical protein